MKQILNIVTKSSDQSLPQAADVLVVRRQLYDAIVLAFLLVRRAAAAALPHICAAARGTFLCCVTAASRRFRHGRLRLIGVGISGGGATAAPAPAGRLGCGHLRLLRLRRRGHLRSVFVLFQYMRAVTMTVIWRIWCRRKWPHRAAQAKRCCSCHMLLQLLATPSSKLVGTCSAVPERSTRTGGAAGTARQGTEPSKKPIQNGIHLEGLVVQLPQADAAALVARR